MTKLYTYNDIRKNEQLDNKCSSFGLYVYEVDE